MNFVRALALMVCVSPIFAQYGGPAILVRGQAPSTMTASQIDFQPSLGVNMGYASGLGGVSVDNQGRFTTDSSYFVSANAAISGMHSWRHMKLGLNYSISGSHNPQAAFFDGITQSLSIGLTRTLSRHVALSFNTSAGMSSQNNQGVTLLSTVPFDPSTLYRPTNDFYDNRTIFVSSQVNLSVQKSTRLSYSVGADGFLTRRRSTALYGVGGLGARGDIMYRVGRRSTIGVAYNYIHFAFNGIFSSTDAHTVVGTYARTLTRSTEFSGYVGVSRYETKFVQTVAVDPAIAALIGIGSAQRVVYSVNTTPNFAARLSRTVHKGTIFVSAGRAITPGNGLFLTSTSTTATAGYSYTGLRRWSLAASSSYGYSNSVGNVIGNYSNFNANLNAGRKIAPHTSGTLGFNMSHAVSGDFKNYNKWQYAVNLGLSFTPGDVTVRFW
ncbi:MAG: hypothetical protein JWP63_6559 [Candidatus Solibacter sp.]|nr:hypothetical protein [Candidatus Solibacter sp.]